jgi:alpha-D-ribose 1-methylphosphonate 5-triphosphate synthase subunit PhnI
VHYAELLSIDAWMLTLYGAFAAGTTLPRLLVAFGVTTAVLHLSGIVLPVFVGVPGEGMLGVPMAFSHVALAGWCLAGRLGRREVHDAGRVEPGASR